MQVKQMLDGLPTGQRIREMKIRIIDWNISYNSKKERIVEFIKENLTENFIINLQEVQEHVFSYIKEQFPGYSIAYSLNYRKPGFYEEKNRRLGVLTLSDLSLNSEATLLTNTVFPERTLLTTFKIKDEIIKNLNFHSLTGCDYKRAKSSNFASIASFLHDNKLNIMTFDANEPKNDSLNDEEVVCFDNKDKGKNASYIIGSNKIHDMQDCYKSYCKINHFQYEKGFTHIIRNDTYKRYDYIFADKNWELINFQVLYRESVIASSDHAMIIADLDIKQRN